MSTIRTLIYKGLVILCLYVLLWDAADMVYSMQKQSLATPVPTTAPRVRQTRTPIPTPTYAPEDFYASMRASAREVALGETVYATISLSNHQNFVAAGYFEVLAQWRVISKTDFTLQPYTASEWIMPAKLEEPGLNEIRVLVYLDYYPEEPLVKLAYITVH